MFLLSSDIIRITKTYVCVFCSLLGLNIAFLHAVLDICHPVNDNIGTYQVRLPLWFAPKYDTKKKHARRRR
jgi:hypothetical protein